MLIASGRAVQPRRALDKARDDLASCRSSPRFDAPATQLDAGGQLPITFFTAERPAHAVDFGASYSTDLGVGLTAGWHHRNLFGNAEQLNLTAAFQGGGNSQIRPGYKVNAQFIKPGFLARDQSLEANIGAVKQSLIAYDQKALLRIGRDQPHSFRRIGRAASGSPASRSSSRRKEFRGATTCIGVPLTFALRQHRQPAQPDAGIRAELMVTPEHR